MQQSDFIPNRKKRTKTQKQKRITHMQPAFIPNTAIPVHSVDLIEWLNKAYPSRCPSTSMSDRDIWVYTGKRQLIEGLVDSLAQADEIDTSFEDGADF